MSLRSRLPEKPYQEALVELASLREPVDEFFENVMVNTNEKRMYRFDPAV
ncbi:hypothetical protein ACLK1X_19880 [Escherichia coli]